ncbi:hypothetical protein PCASD_03099 [Puccinia coronata f. sp. avenae]|uniref:Uncharacterized protein n=2 Tax=Puccinia coronata f. sp. avenae TaxID=200324 RepID=A0A2N5V5V2_9BASI|nr:hypothetical protein PCASD_03099 [Puccinia coronata f. sp. avenae]
MDLQAAMELFNTTAAQASMELFNTTAAQASMELFNTTAAQASMELVNAMAAQAAMELFNAMQWGAIVSIQTAGPLYSPVSCHNPSSLATGTHAFYKGLAKEARATKKQEITAHLSKKSGSSSAKDSKQSTEKRFLKSGVQIYIDDKLQKRTGIIPQVLEVDTKNKNFYEDLRNHLWSIFSDEILAKTEITFPPDPEQYISLGTGDSKIESHRTLLELAKSGKAIKTPAVINLFYQHPLDTFPESNIQTQAKSTRKRKNEEEHPNLTKSDTWALGGSIATKPIRGSASLSSQVNVLSHPVSKSFKMQTDGWTTAQRLQIYTTEEPPPPASKHQSFIINEYLCAITVPIDIQVDRKKHVGQGSSRHSHPAKPCQ